MNQIPPWVLRLALLLSLPIAGAALFLTRTYAVGNLVVLGLDADTVFVRRLSIDVLLSAHVVAFFLCALLPDSVFKFRRWQLYALALAIWVFDAGAIYQARFGVMESADKAQVSATTRLADQRAAIRDLHESAEALRATADRQLANKMITAGAASQREAARLTAKAAAMSERLASMPDGAGTTEVSVWSWFAPYKAAIESALISFVSLIMLGLAGLMLRELLQPAVMRRPARLMLDKPPAPPAETRLNPQAGRAMVSPAPEPSQVQAPAVAPVAPAQVHTPVSAQVQQAAPVMQKRTPKTAPDAPGTRTKEVVLKELVQAVRAGEKKGGCNPTQRSIRAFVDCGQPAADWYLAGLAKLDVIEPNPSGRGWRLKVAKP